MSVICKNKSIFQLFSKCGKKQIAFDNAFCGPIEAMKVGKENYFGFLETISACYKKKSDVMTQSIPKAL